MEFSDSMLTLDKQQIDNLQLKKFTQVQCALDIPYFYKSTTKQI